MIQLLCTQLFHTYYYTELPAHYDAVASSPSVRPESYDDVLLSVYDKVGRDENLETEEEIRCVKPPAPPPPPCAPNPSPGPPSIVQKSYYDDVILSNKTSRDKNQKSKDREKPPAPPPKEQYSTVPMEMKAVVVVSEDMPHQSYNHLIHEPVSHKSVTVPASVQREYSSFGSTRYATIYCYGKDNSLSEICLKNTGSNSRVYCHFKLGLRRRNCPALIVT